MTEGKARRGLSDRPLLFATVSVFLGALAAAGLLAWASGDPVTVIVGQSGRHDQAHGATCLDCHVPFEGSPSSRCLAPGCHGDLATGTPPRDGPAMPLRFHVALRGQACSQCHTEHARDVLRAFEHRRIPQAVRAGCRACHLGERVKAHARTDAVSCEVCHTLDNWSEAQMSHKKVSAQPCDLCHRRPETEEHASVAGTCTDCHVSSSWAPKPTQDAEK